VAVRDTRDARARRGRGRHRRQPGCGGRHHRRPRRGPGGRDGLLSYDAASYSGGMAERSTSLGDLERAVMDVLWGAPEPRSVRAVHETLADRGLAYTTVMTVLDRLAKKGLAVRERAGRAWLYRAAGSREELAAESISQSLAHLGTD